MFDHLVPVSVSALVTLYKRLDRDCKDDRLQDFSKMKRSRKLSKCGVIAGAESKLERKEIKKKNS